MRDRRPIRCHCVLTRIFILSRPHSSRSQKDATSTQSGTGVIDINGPIKTANSGSDSGAEAAQVEDAPPPSKYHTDRELASVDVPSLDCDSVDKLPPALKQLADYNPRGDHEGEQLPPRRKRKAVPLAPDFVKEPVFKGSGDAAAIVPARRQANSNTPSTTRVKEAVLKGSGDTAAIVAARRQANSSTPSATRVSASSTTGGLNATARSTPPATTVMEHQQASSSSRGNSAAAPTPSTARSPPKKPRTAPTKKSASRDSIIDTSATVVIPSALSPPKRKMGTKSPGTTTPTVTMLKSKSRPRAQSAHPSQAIDGQLRSTIPKSEPAEEPELLTPDEILAYEEAAKTIEAPKPDPSTLPKALRQLLDHNPRGYDEVLPPRRRKLTERKFASDNANGGGEAELATASALQPKVVPQKIKRISAADVAVAAAALACAAPRIIPRAKEPAPSGLNKVVPTGDIPVGTEHTREPSSTAVVTNSTDELQTPPSPEVVIPPLDKYADTTGLPKELLRLRDHNVRGQVEAAVAEAKGRRRPKAPSDTSLAEPETRVLTTSPSSNSVRPQPPTSQAKKRSVEEKSGAGPAADNARVVIPPQPAAVKEDPFAELLQQTPRDQLPASLRSLLDHNGKGGNEVAPLPPRRAPKPIVPLELGADWISGRDSSSTKRRRKSGPAVGLDSPESLTGPEARAATVVPKPLSKWVIPRAPPDAPRYKIWVLLGQAAHRRFKLAMGSQYRYKQYVPTPAFLREHKYPFTVRVHGEGEIICTVGDSHYVVSGCSRGFSWSHVDPSTMERLEESDQRYGSRQGDGKPNTFSAHFFRSTKMMDQLRSNLAAAKCWNQPPEEARARVLATAVCPRYTAARKAEGWHDSEIRPLYLPTVEQFADPLWFTSMMAGPGKEDGSLHIKMPMGWLSDEAHNFGHVQWPASSPLWRLEVVPPQPPNSILSTTVSTSPPNKQSSKAGGVGAASSASPAVMGIKVSRPETSGVRLDSDMVTKGQREIQVPTSPAGLTEFITALPEVVEAAPLLYGPQSKCTPLQMAELQKVVPACYLPLSEADGLRGVFGDVEHLCEGTTTPTGFGGNFGITGLHDEYNHTVSVFCYPLWNPAK